MFRDPFNIFFFKSHNKPVPAFSIVIQANSLSKLLGRSHFTKDLYCLLIVLRIYQPGVDL